jgi:hypothetical protein
MGDRAAILARIADDFMENGLLMLTDELAAGGMRSLRAEIWPEHPAMPQEVRFAAEWPGITLVCSRPFAGGPHGV